LGSIPQLTQTLIQRIYSKRLKSNKIKEIEVASNKNKQLVYWNKQQHNKQQAFSCTVNNCNNMLQQTTIKQQTNAKQRTKEEMKQQQV
jgi:hypothetical protein